MKSLIVLLLVLGVYSQCASDEFRVGTACIPCEESRCETCKGTDRCAKCPDGIEDSVYGQCSKCEDGSSIPINKVCKSCDEIQPGLTPVNGMDCSCGANPDCCTANGIYEWTLDTSEYFCSPCSFDVVGCSKCKYSVMEDDFACSACIEGFELIGEGQSAICVSYSGHLFAIVGLLISLLILA